MEPRPPAWPLLCLLLLCPPSCPGEPGALSFCCGFFFFPYSLFSRPSYRSSPRFQPRTGRDAVPPRFAVTFPGDDLQRGARLHCSQPFIHPPPQPHAAIRDVKRHVASNPLPAPRGLRERRIAPGIAADGRRAVRQGALFKTQTLFLWLPPIAPPHLVLAPHCSTVELQQSGAAPRAAHLGQLRVPSGSPWLLLPSPWFVAPSVP